MDELLTCTALSKWYGPKRALDQLELHVGRGKIIGLLGPNGCLLYTSDAADE